MLISFTAMPSVSRATFCSLQNTYKSDHEQIDRFPKMVISPQFAFVVDCSAIVLFGLRHSHSAANWFNLHNSTVLVLWFPRFDIGDFTFGCGLPPLLDWNKMLVPLAVARDSCVLQTKWHNKNAAERIFFGLLNGTQHTHARKRGKTKNYKFFLIFLFAMPIYIDRRAKSKWKDWSEFLFRYTTHTLAI